MQQYAAIDPVDLGLRVTGRSGFWFYTKCPFHDDSTPSAEFNALNGTFYCFVCDEAYSAKELARELGGEIRELRSDYVFSARREEFEWHTLLNAPLALGNAYMRVRKITDEQVKTFGIRDANGVIVFPSKNVQGAVTGVVLRRTDGSQPRYQKLGRVSHLWPTEALATSSREVVVVEGVFGALRVRQAGYDAFAQLKASPSSEALTLLNGKRVTGFFDDDLPGCVGALKLLCTGAKMVSPGDEADELPLRELVLRISRASRSRLHFLNVVKRAGKIRLLRRLGYVK